MFKRMFLVLSLILASCGGPPDPCESERTITSGVSGKVQAMVPVGTYVVPGQSVIVLSTPNGEVSVQAPYIAQVVAYCSGLYVGRAVTQGEKLFAFVDRSE